MSSQKDILQAFSEGKFDTGSNRPEHIETVISNIFLTEDRVYKLYKSDSDFFNTDFSDLSTRETRFAFTRADFAWNQQLCPEVYTRIRGVQVLDGSVVWSEENPEELVIEMHRLDMKDGLLNHLARKDLSESDYYQIGYQLGKRLQSLSSNQPPVSLRDNFSLRLKDVEPWARAAEPHFSPEELDSYMETIQSLLKEQRTLTEGNTVVTVDVHAENAVYIDGTLLLIDTYPPKQEWIAGHPNFNAYRVAVDVYAMVGEEGFRAVLKGHEASTGRTLQKEEESFFVLYNCLIMCPYLYMLAKNNERYRALAEQYRDFTRQYVAVQAKSALGK